jgi:hypothetical protein
VGAVRNLLGDLDGLAQPCTSMLAEPETVA